MTANIVSPVVAVSDSELREQPGTSLNRLCNMVDWQAWSPLTNTMNEFHENVTIHRKSWEYAMCILGLKQFGLVHENARALGVGAGSERPLYYFANCVEEMVATDIYDTSHDEGRPGMLTHPENFAPFPYRQDHLKVLQMSGDDLRFPDEYFDFVFCLSSIEHFGSRDTQRKSLGEMRRVIKPGGVVCIATELILNDTTHPEFFTFPELESVFLRYPGLELVGGPLDLRIAQSLVDYPVMLETTKNPSASPHIVLSSGGVMWTSVMLFLQRV